MKIIILLGRQGSGKGTQARLLANEFGFEYIGSGDLLRSFYEGTTFSAKKTKELMERGEYTPTPLIFRLWMDRLEFLKNKDERFSGIILDGSPRKMLEAKLLDQALVWYEWDKEVQVLLIEISRATGFDRLTKRRICKKCGKLIPWVGTYKDLKACDACGGRLITRADDTPEGINSRLDLFESETLPVTEYYKKTGKVKTINGEQSIEDVYKDIKAQITNSKQYPL